MAGHYKPSLFPFAADDPLAAEHELVGRWVQEAVSSLSAGQYYQDVELKASELGRKILESSPERSRLLVKAAVEQSEFWLFTQKELKARAGDLSLFKLPGWAEAFGSEKKATAIVSALLRRTLPLERSDIFQLLGWIVQGESSYGQPLSYVTKALLRYVAQHGVDAELGGMVTRFVEALRQSHSNDAKRLATTVGQICAQLPQQDEAIVACEMKAAPLPAPAGNRLVLLSLKTKLGMLEPDEKQEFIVIGPDRYQMPEGSPLAAAHDLLTRLLVEKIQQPRWNRDMDEFAAGQPILSLEAVAKGKVLAAAMERHMASMLAPAVDYSDGPFWKAHSGLSGIVSRLGKETVEFSRELVFDGVLYLAMSRHYMYPLSENTDRSILDAIETLTSRGVDLSEGERYVLALWRLSRIRGPLLGTSPSDIAQLTRWIGDGAQYFLVPGERWSDMLNSELAALPKPEREKWLALVQHGLSATGARPSAKWQKTGRTLLDEIGEETFRQAMERWFPQVNAGRSHTLDKDPRGIGDTIHDENANVLRGFLWLLPMLKRRDGVARLAASVALTAYRKVPGVGPRAVKVGNAAVYALSEMVGPEAMGQLAMLKVRVRFGSAQKEVEKAFDAAASALQLPRAEIEELSVPDCGLTDVGLREERFGEYRVRVEVNASDIVVSWFDGKGKPIKSVPNAIKKDHAEEWKELQGDIKDLQAMISAQKERVDGLFLEQKTWPARVWRERYIDHAVMGTIARRLIWVVDGLAITVVNGKAEDIRGHAIEVADDATVTLWHPAGLPVDEVLAWRERIESLGVVQPFKQAHREVYIVTDAERRTERYSNRFAAHILRQHQFNALCGTRRWKNKLRLLVDDEYPPASRELNAWGLRAEFWIEGIGDEFGLDTNESGTYLRLSSDQVRFYRTGAAPNSAHAGGGGYRARAFGPGDNGINEPLLMDEVPPLVFSEIMRDVDLFVGVGSIGNDPIWQDGGRENRYGEYWRNYSFGELSTTALSRRGVLERLIPRLKIADRCVLSDRFLLIQGTRRRYKIHLGSGNILMEPNDQYLCIVPDAKARSSTPQVYLPFEGDSTLSIILSKAFLLADDTKIKDPVILRQLGE